MFLSDSSRTKWHCFIILLSCLVSFPALSRATSPESRSADLFLLSGAPGFHFWDESGLGWGPAFRDVRGLGAQRTAVTIDGVETSFSDPRHGFRSPLPGPWNPRHVPTVNRSLYDQAATSANAAATIKPHSRADIPPETNVDKGWLAASAGASAVSSGRKSPRWLSSSSPIGVSREIGSCEIF